VDVGFVTIDCRDAERLIAFWSGALKYEVRRDVYTTVRDPSGKGVTLFFQEVPEPPQGKNRVHLDLVGSAFDEDMRALLELGATKIRDVSENGLTWAVLADPEGNVFCLFDGSEG
jgi:catechol 2,3-dioxygenase-like lactoylglutathione lyase family enzyme